MKEYALSPTTKLSAAELEGSPKNLFPDVSDANTIEELNQAMTDNVHRFGFSDYFFVSSIRGRQMKFMCSASEEFTSRYFSEKMHEHDMLLSHAVNHHKPVYASALYEYLLDSPVEDDAIERQKRIHHWFKKFGFYDAYVVPISLPETNERSVMFYLFRYCSTYDLGRSVQRQEVMLLALGEVMATTLKNRLVTDRSNRG